MKNLYHEKVYWLSSCGLILLFLFPCSHGNARFGPGNGPENELFTTAGVCSKCHNNLTSQDDEEDPIDTSYVSRWETTMMRFSFYDPFWRAKVRSETLREPDSQDVIEQKCMTCHAPMAYKQMEKDDSFQPLFEIGGLVESENEYHSLAMDGVSCTLCHQITDEPSDSGGFSIEEQRVAWGPFQPDFQNMMNRSSGFVPSQSFHLEDPAFCATCHELYTP